MLLTVSYSLKLRLSGMKSEEFPDTEILHLPDYTLNILKKPGSERKALEDHFINTVKGLFRQVKQTVLEDFNDYIDGNKSLVVPTTKKILTNYKPVLTTAITQKPSKELLDKFREVTNMSDQNNKSISTASLLRITGGYRKNAIISDYHSEEYISSIEKSIQEDLTEPQIMAEQLYLNALAEKAVIMEMSIDGLIPDNIVAQKLTAIEKKMQIAKNSAK